MNENLARKNQIVEEVHKEFLSANLAVLAEYRGVNVADMSVLRRNARENNVHIRIVKNTLARRAVEDTDFQCLSEHLQGPLAIASSEDAVAAAKTVSDFSKDVKNFKVCIGAMDGALVTAESLSQIAKLPPRDVILGQLLGTMAAPMQRFVGTLNELPARLARTLSAVRDSKAE